MVSPIRFLANRQAVESMVAVLAEIEIQRRVADNPEPRHRLGENSGVVVKAWTNDEVVSHFTVGASAGEETFIQRAGEAPVYAVQGRCRRMFEKSLDQLRHPVITRLELTDIERVVYANGFGEIDLVVALNPGLKPGRNPGPSNSGPSNPGRFREASPSIPNFNSARASKNVAVLAGLRARGFVDSPFDRSATGLFNEDTARATLSLRGQKNPLLVWIGARTSDGRLHLRTSDSEQVYLVSGHLASSLIPRRRHFERSDEHMQQLRAAQGNAPAAGPGTDNASQEPEHRPEHSHGKPPPTQIPPSLMRELRDLAAEQHP